jgi:hypothetical protein
VSTVTIEKPHSKLDSEIGKPLAGAVFVLGWAIAIVAWSVLHNFSDFGTRGFIADLGILAAAIGFSAPFLASKRSLVAACGWGAVALGLFAIGDFGHVTILVYTLRLLIPLLALLTPLYKLLSFRIF